MVGRARWGHPEDAVAVGLLLYAVLAQGSGRTALAGWLAGAAVCVQPLVLLALPVMLALLPWRRMPPFLVRAALPSAVLVAAAAIADWHDTYQSVTSQPDSPVINHPTIWTSLAPHLANTNVAAGPFRLATIAARLPVRAGHPPPLDRPQPGGRRRPGRAPARQRALVGRLRAGPPLVLRAGDGLLLPVAADGGRADPRRHARLAPPVSAGLLAGGLTAAAQGPSHAVWIWWAPIVAGLIVLLAISWPRLGAT